MQALPPQLLHKLSTRARPSALRSTKNSSALIKVWIVPIDTTTCFHQNCYYPAGYGCLPAHIPLQAIVYAVKMVLVASAELRAIFGSSVLALEGRQRRAPPGPNRRGQPQHTRARLLSQQADLPPYDGSLTMSCISSGTDAVSAFRIEPSSRYRTATLHFEQAQVTPPRSRMPQNKLP